MKAWVLDQSGPIEAGPVKLVDLPLPSPATGQVRLKVLVCGLCRTDLHIAEGDLPLHRSPVVLGHEIVGRVDVVGEGVAGVEVGDLVGVTWLGRTCGACRHCRSGRENYCAAFQAIGWDLDGGFAEYTIVDADAVLPLAGIALPHEELAPLLCPGVAGYAAFHLTGVSSGQRLGLYGFGPTADYVLRVARHLEIDVYVSSRSGANRDRASHLGAVWVEDAARTGMPVQLQASVVFPPAGPLVEAALGGDFDLARELHYRLRPLMAANFAEASPGGVKAALALMGLCDEHLRLPLVPIGEAARGRLRTALVELRLLPDRQHATAS